MKKTACIVTGGRVLPEFLKKMTEAYNDELLIVVDGALEVTHSISLEPDYIVGDFDTVNPLILQEYGEKKIMRHLPEKDQTDTELAIETAVAAGCSKIKLYGAVGSRIDHSLANIFLLQRMLKMNLDAVIYDESNKLYLKDKGFKIKKTEQYGNFVSLLPLTECVENVTLNGFKYSLSNHTFFRECTLGVSNEITEEEATVEFTEGMFLVVESKDK